MNSEKRISSNIIVLGIICLIILIFAILYNAYKPDDLISRSIKIKKDTLPSVMSTSSSTNLKDYILNANSSTTQEIKVLVVGDTVLDRDVRILINRKGFDSFFSGVRDLVKNADIAVANLEGPFTANTSITTNPKNTELKFTFDPNLAQSLSDLGFDILGLANNHTLNFGQEGLDATRRYIGEAGMVYYGDPNNKDEISVIYTQKNIKVGFIGFHEFSYINFDKVFNEINRLRPLVDVLIVTPHWGVEYEKNRLKNRLNGRIFL